MLIDPQARYAASHEWARPEGAMFVVGLSAYAVMQLGKLRCVELPPVGKVLARGEVFATVESVKSAVQLSSPISGRVAAVNAVVGDDPDRLKRDVYQTGWLVKIQPSDPAEIETMMTAQTYRAFLESGA